ncbi:MAG: sigma 54-interacting transcriptional regulator [Polyangiaceae bacterium]|nr:sigma 54-interacting transcriptional regulator [Polyangiaceae bacterium]
MPHDDETLPIGATARDDGPRDVLIIVGHAGGVGRPLAPGEEVVIGRGAECDVVVDDPSISRRHARLRVIGEGLSLCDLGSRNGTRKGGLLLARGVEAALARGEVVELGNLALVVQRHRGVAEAAVAVAAASRGARSAAGTPAHDVVVGGAVARLLALLERVAQANISVLLLGETGVGKDVFAEILHRRSPRAAGPFVRVHAAALSPSLLESELFGHEAGAFTGAARAKAGLLEAADGGTVFLDEVGELPPATQVKLLRVIEDREVTRVGAVRGRKLDLRFVAATNRPLSDERSRGDFRSDLYFRLSAMTLTIPPLRERRDEIPALARAFLAQSSPSLRLSESAQDALVRHPWPGNVRELKNVMARAAVVAEAGLVQPSDLGLEDAAPALREHDGPALSGEQREEARRIALALAQTAGNQTEAARLLGVSRRTLVTRLGQYGLPRPRGQK